MTDKSKIQSKADATCCRAVLALVEQAMKEFEIAKATTDVSSNEDYVIIREQIKACFTNAHNLLQQGIQVLDPPQATNPTIIPSGSIVVSEEEYNKMKEQIEAINEGE